MRIVRLLPVLLSAVLVLSCGRRQQYPQQPTVVFGGEMHNSNASTPQSIESSLDIAVSLGFDAVLAPVYWELMEPEQGRFDFTLVDHLLSAAGERGLKLGLLWFGTWKNGESSYPPLWVKGNTQKYFRALDADGNPTTTISPFCKAALEADAAAFSDLMSHLAKADRDRVVINVQVENEVGAFLERDFSPAALEAWEKGGWQADTAFLAPQRFMAEAFAKYVDAVAAAGKAEYDIPMFTNAWLMGAKAPYGSYPNGGPREAVLDVWKRCAPHLDWLSPDIYAKDFAHFCAVYGEDQPLFIPETKREPGRLWYALGEAAASGVFSFGYEESYDDPLYVYECRTIAEMIPLLRQRYPSRGFWRNPAMDAKDAELSLPLGGVDFKVHYIGGEPNAYGVIVQTGEDEFTVAGVGAWIDFGEGVKMAYCEEIRDGGVWQVLNGDETAHHNMLYLRGRLYQEAAVMPGDEYVEVPAPMYGLSYQRRFLKSSHLSFKTSGIYRIKLYSQQ